MSDQFEDGLDPEEEALLDEEPELKQRIDEWLSEVRPERYETVDRDSWMGPVYEKVVCELEVQPPQDVVWDAARQLVRSREKQATRKANDFLRRIGIDGQPPLGWDGASAEWKALSGGYLRMPLAIGSERVRLGAASPSDYENWVIDHRDKDDKRVAAQVHAYNGALLLAQWAREQGVERTEALRFSADAETSDRDN